MSPKSRLYTLVHAWKNKPFHELRDVQGTHALNQAHETQDTGSNANWSKRQTVSYEPIFNAAGNAMSGALFRPLLGATDSQVLRFTMEGLDAASYWHCCNRPIQILLPLSPSVVANPQRIDALCDLILNFQITRWPSSHWPYCNAARGTAHQLQRGLIAPTSHRCTAASDECQSAVDSAAVARRNEIRRHSFFNSGATQ